MIVPTIFGPPDYYEMINDIHFPLSITGHELDDYLSRGWYRMGQTIFTSDIMPFSGNLHTLHWLRIAVQKVHYGRSQKKILGKNKDLAVEIKPFSITPEIEELYGLYKASINFSVSSSAEAYLLDGAIDNIYNTQVIEIRDGGKLIAVGYFDTGETSIAGILNFYHPEYKARSLGKYLMLLKIEHARKLAKEWYYLGYIANGYPKFDYKLFPDIKATEVFESATKEWLPFSLPLTSGIWEAKMVASYYLRL